MDAVMTASLRILVSSPHKNSHLLADLERLSLPLVPHDLGTVAGVDLDTVGVAVLEVGEQVDLAKSQTRRWRLELGDRHLPILWVVAHENAMKTGLEAGADTCLLWPVGEGILAAQVQAALRVRQAFLAQQARADEARLLGGPLQKTLRELALVQEICLRLHRKRGRTDSLRHQTLEIQAFQHPAGQPHLGPFARFTPIDEDRVAFAVGDAGTEAPALQACLTLLMTDAFTSAATDSALREPHRLLASINREILALKRDEPAFLSLLLGMIHTGTGELTFARAGGTAPVLIRADGEMQAVAPYGPALGVFEAEFESQRLALQTGERLLLTAHGPVEDAEKPVRSLRWEPVIRQHRHQPGREFLAAIADSVTGEGKTASPIALLLLERVVASEAPSAGQLPAVRVNPPLELW